MNSKPATIDEYIAAFPKEVQGVLAQLRETVRQAAPDCEEIISYGMPALRFNKAILVYFAAFKNHIGFYALPSGNEAFKNELLNYKTGKGSVQFPLDKPMPLDLIKSIVVFRIAEVLAKKKK